MSFELPEPPYEPDVALVLFRTGGEVISQPARRHTAGQARNSPSLQAVNGRQRT